MPLDRFKFLSTEDFGKLPQGEKLDYLARAMVALGKTMGMDTTQDSGRRSGDVSPGTLGAVLYAGRSKPRIPEMEWVGLLECVAVGDQRALHELYDRAHRPVFTLIMKLIGYREAAEELTLAVFYDVWRQAPLFDSGKDTVLGWIMNLARARAIERLRLEPRSDRARLHAGEVRPAASLQRRLARRIAAQAGGEVMLPPESQWSEPQWEKVAPGIACKLFATDTEKHRVSMLVRLAPGGDYPPHTHAGVEELHLLDGELWIDDRKLYPGDYNRAEPGTGDKRVWSETGCTCVLTTSTRDVLA